MRDRIINTAMLLCLLAFGTAIAQPGNTDLGNQRTIAFGTTINPKAQMAKSRQFAQSLAVKSPQWRAKGDQLRTYHFAEAGADMPYRIFVPTSWDGKSTLPVVMFLHGAWNDESAYLDANDKQMLKLAEQHGFLLIAPLGYNKLGAYGTCLKLPALFGKPEEAAKQMASRTPEQEHTRELSEMDVINVLELVLNEYPVDRSSMYLTGHSMGSGGTLYLGAKYPTYWKALAPMSGPFVLENLYPWDRIRKMPIFLSEGTRSTASLDASRKMGEWMKKQGFTITYKEVDGDHAGMVPLILPYVFAFFDR